jgi:hypothetical protein
MRQLIVFAALAGISSGCNMSSPGVSPAPLAAPARVPLGYESTALADAIKRGDLTIEVRGLQNQATTNTFGTVTSTTFTHKAIVIAGGKQEFSKSPFFVFFTIKRLSGGDPDAPRKPDEMVIALVKDGIGDISFSGGYRTSDKKWDPEKIELDPYGIEAVVPISLAATREQ